MVVTPLTKAAVLPCRSVGRIRAQTQTDSVGTYRYPAQAANYLQHTLIGDPLWDGILDELTPLPGGAAAAGQRRMVL